MENITFRVAQRDDYRTLTPWLVEMSQAPEQHCLHTWVSGSADELEQQLLNYLDDGELCYVLALQDGRVVGAMGGEYDEELGRGWLHGPHAVAEQWEEIAAGLFTRLRSALPGQAPDDGRAVTCVSFIGSSSFAAGSPDREAGCGQQKNRRSREGNDGLIN